jgi:flagellar biosynthesis protein FlhA
VLADHGGKVKDADLLTEHVRERLGSVICQQITEGRPELQVLTFDSGVEQTISGALRTIDDKSALVLDPRVAEQVLRKLSEETDRMARTNVRPVLLCPPSLRRHVRRFTERLVPQLSVLSLNEIPGHVSLRGFGVVKV